MLGQQRVYSVISWLDIRFFYSIREECKFIWGINFIIEGSILGFLRRGREGYVVQFCGVGRGLERILLEIRLDQCFFLVGVQSLIGFYSYGIFVYMVGIYMCQGRFVVWIQEVVLFKFVFWFIVKCVFQECGVSRDMSDSGMVWNGQNMLSRVVFLNRKQGFCLLRVLGFFFVVQKGDFCFQFSLVFLLRFKVILRLRSFWVLFEGYGGFVGVGF